MAMNKKTVVPILISILILGSLTDTEAQRTALWSSGNSLIPYPQKVQMTGERFKMEDHVTLYIDRDASPQDLFTAGEMKRILKEEFNIGCTISTEEDEGGIIL